MLAEFRWKSKRLTVVASVPGAVTVELDAVFVLRLLGNLLANAIAAAPPDSTLRVALDRMDGMLNPEVSGGGFDPTGLRDRDGRLWFSTIDGIAMIDPSAFPING